MADDGTPVATQSAEAAGYARRIVLRRILLLIVLPAIVMLAGLVYYAFSGRYVSTDNAYIGADKVLITPEVSGKIVRIAVVEGQALKPGDELVEIDPEPYRLAVQDVEAKLAKAATDFASAKSNLTGLTRQVELARETLAVTEQDYERKNRLLRDRYSAPADVDRARMAVMAVKAQLAQLEQQQTVLRNQLLGDPELPLDSYPPYMEARVALDRARLNLANTTLKAPIAGTATQVASIQMGRYLAAGTAIFAIVGSETVWVDANPKETDLTFVRPGQPVTITVDAFPAREWHGTVAAISPGTGGQFSILPPQNATGNWVKVVQRVPVRIAFAPGADTHDLRAGMSAVVEIDTGRRSRLAAFLSRSAVAGGSKP